MSDAVVFWILVAVAIFVLLLCREVMAWYWKIDQHLANQRTLIDEVRRLREAISQPEDTRSPMTPGS